MIILITSSGMSVNVLGSGPIDEHVEQEDGWDSLSISAHNEQLQSGSSSLVDNILSELTIGCSYGRMGSQKREYGIT